MQGYEEAEGDDDLDDENKKDSKAEYQDGFVVHG